MQTEGYVFYGIVALIIGAIVWRHGRRNRLLARRKNSLRYDEVAGVYVWLGLDGVQRTSEIHPDRQGGAWYDEGQRASSVAGYGGDVGGGDFGGAGGGE